MYSILILSGAVGSILLLLSAAVMVALAAKEYKAVGRNRWTWIATWLLIVTGMTMVCQTYLVDYGISLFKYSTWCFLYNGYYRMQTRLAAYIGAYSFFLMQASVWCLLCYVLTRHTQEPKSAKLRTVISVLGVLMVVCYAAIVLATPDEQYCNAIIEYMHNPLNCEMPPHNN